jgi:hypothetical protein
MPARQYVFYKVVSLALLCFCTGVQGPTPNQASPLDQLPVARWVSSAEDVERLKLPLIKTRLRKLELVFDSSAELGRMRKALKETLPTLKNLEALKTNKCLDFLPCVCKSVRTLYYLPERPAVRSLSETDDWFRRWTNLERVGTDINSLRDVRTAFFSLQPLTRVTSLFLSVQRADLLLRFPSELRFLTQLKALCIDLLNSGNEEQLSQSDSNVEIVNSKIEILSITQLDFATSWNDAHTAQEKAISAFLACLPQLKVLRLLNHRRNFVHGRFETKALCADDALGVASLQHVTRLEMLGAWKTNTNGPGWPHLATATSLKSLVMTTNTADPKSLIELKHVLEPRSRSGELTTIVRSDPMTVGDMICDAVSWKKDSCFPDFSIYGE